MQFVAQEFSDLNSFDGPAEVADYEFHRCQFFNVDASPQADPASRLHIRRIVLTHCTYWNCSLYGAALEDIVVDNLKRGGRSPLFFWDCAFRHVVLRGPLSFFKINAQVDISKDSSRSRAFRKANERFYLETDWALDITAAQFGGLVDFPGIPPHLVRRDPATQFIMLRSLAPRFLEPSYPPDVWSQIASDALTSSDEGIVVALGRRARTFGQDLQRAEELRAAALLA